MSNASMDAQGIAFADNFLHRLDTLPQCPGKDCYPVAFVCVRYAAGKSGIATHNIHNWQILPRT